MTERMPPSDNFFNDRPADIGVKGSQAVTPARNSVPAASPESIELHPERWVEDHGEYLFRYARRYFRDRSRVEDIVQDTLLAAVSSRHSFKGGSSVRTWLTGILKHKILDAIRRRSKEEATIPLLEDDSTVERSFDSVEHWINSEGPRGWASDAEKIIEQREFLTALQGCLTKLPERLRQLFLSREIDELSREELAEHFNLTVTNVGVILYRTRLTLQRCLQVVWLGGVAGGSA